MTGVRLARVAAWTPLVGGAATAGYLGLVTGAVPVDVGVGRRTRPLGPQTVDIAAPGEVVFEVVARPYLGRNPRAMREKLNVLERGSDLPAEHFTPIAGGRLRAATVETVRFARPDRIDFVWFAARCRRRPSPSRSPRSRPGRGWCTRGSWARTCGGRRITVLDPPRLHDEAGQPRSRNRTSPRRGPGTVTQPRSGTAAPRWHDDLPGRAGQHRGPDGPSDYLCRDT